MKWHISIFTADGKRLIFAAPVEDRKEAAALATEARHRSPSAQIFLRDPRGNVTTWD